MPLVFAHIGDLHITKAKEQNYIDFLSIVAQIETECGGQLDFVFLPGDNADNGLPEQYKLVATALKMLQVPVHIIAGDHDMEQGSLQFFYEGLNTEQLPKSLLIKGYRCIFIDVCGSGKGGPDFRLGNDQLLWLENELALAKQQSEQILLFMHTYPDDLKDRGEVAFLNKLIAENQVLLVDMGHTHYNELANDGATIFAATRSTGQIEEGPVGYSLTTVDDGIVSWRFKPLQDAFPFVMITNPADYRLKCNENEITKSVTTINAVVFGIRKMKHVYCKVDDGDWITMQQLQDGRTWSAENVNLLANAKILTVEAVDETGSPGRHSIQLNATFKSKKMRAKDGSDKDSIGAWPENGIFGTQLGPNRNGKPS